MGLAFGRYQKNLNLETNYTLFLRCGNYCLCLCSIISSQEFKTVSIENHLRAELEWTQMSRNN
jgi:hypothetical protein